MGSGQSDICTSRYGNRRLDDLGVDIVLPKDAPFHFQCKSYSRRVPYDLILEKMPTDKIPVILSKLTEKRGSRFYKKGEYAILKLEDFYKIINNDCIRANKEWNAQNLPNKA